MRSLILLISFTVLGHFAAAGLSLAWDYPPLEPDKPPTHNLGPLITDTAVPIGQGNVNIQPLAQFGFQGGQFSPNWRRVSSHGDFYNLQVPVQFTYGLTPNTDVQLIIPYLHNWARDARLPSRGTGSADFGGPGDTNLNLKHRLLEDTSRTPTCTVLAGCGFPTGHHRYLNPQKLGTDRLGSGAFAFTAGLNLSKWLYPVYLYANLWYTVPTTAFVDGKRIHPRDKVTLNLAAEWYLTPQWAVIWEFYSNWQAGNLVGPKSQEPAQALLGLVVGLEYILNEHWCFAGGLAVDAAGKKIGYNYTPILTFQYTF